MTRAHSVLSTRHVERLDKNKPLPPAVKEEGLYKICGQEVMGRGVGLLKGRGREQGEREEGRRGVQGRIAWQEEQPATR
eukprot:752670-Hanusia_phi.AAC.4